MLGIDTVGALNEHITNNDMNSLILVQEALQEQKIVEIVNSIKKRKSTKFVMIAGPSSSGKTTFANRLSIQCLTLQILRILEWKEWRVQMVIKSWCRYFTGKFIRAWPAITLHAPDMNEKLWEKKRKLEDAYDRVMSELEDYSGSAYGGVTETIFALFEQFYRKVRMLALPVSGFSLVIGFLLLLLVRRDKLLFRRIFLTFIVGIPGFFLLFTWGIGILLN